MSRHGGLCYCGPFETTGPCLYEKRRKRGECVGCGERIPLDPEDPMLARALYCSEDCANALKTVRV